MSNSDRKNNPERVLLDDLRTKSVEAAADVMAGVQRLKSLHEDIVGEDAESDRARFGDYLYKLARLELEHAANILSLGNTQAEMLFEQVRRLAGKSRGTTPRKVVDIVVQADEPHGRGKVEIRNPFSKEADVRCVLSTFGGQDGQPTTIRPERIDCDPLPPHGHGHVTIVMSSEAIPPTGVYFAELAVFASADVEQEIARRVVKVRKAREDGQ